MLTRISLYFHIGHFNSNSLFGTILGQFFLDGPQWVEQRRFTLRNLRDFGFGTRGKKLEKIIEEEMRDFVDLVQSNVEVSKISASFYLRDLS